MKNNKDFTNNISQNFGAVMEMLNMEMLNKEDVPATKEKVEKNNDDNLQKVLESKKRTKRVQLVMYPFLYEQIKEIANNKHLSFNKYVELLLYEAIKKEKSDYTE